MCLLFIGKLICTFLYAVVVVPLVINIALPHWRIYNDPLSNTPQLQTGIIRSGQGCRPINGGLISFNDNITKSMDVCEIWINDVPTMDAVVFMLLAITVFLFIFNFFWGTFSFCCECCCDRVCMHVLPFTSGIGTICLSTAIIIFYVNYQNDGNTTFIKPEYISLHNSFFMVSSLILPAVISVIIGILSSFYKKVCCEKSKKNTPEAASILAGGNVAAANEQQQQ